MRRSRIICPGWINFLISIVVYINRWPTGMPISGAKCVRHFWRCFLFFFFFGTRKSWNFYIFSEDTSLSGRGRGDEVWKSMDTKRWAHLWFVCFFGGENWTGQLLYRPATIPLGCLLYTLVHRVLPVTRTYLRGISRRRVNKPERVSNY